MNYYQPPVQDLIETGARRRVGVELEFSGLPLDTAAELVAANVDGTVKPETEAESIVQSEHWGDFKIELDWQFGKELAQERQQHYPDADPVMEWLTTIAGQLVPVEIVCPPIAFDELYKLDAMIDALRKAGAVGTFDSVFYAFGVHLNPEIPDLKSQTITRYLKAFLLAQHWLVDKHAVDLSRRLTPYIDLFSSDYARTVFAYTDNVTVEQIIDDYLDHNPTRNRALDMTPLFRHIDEQRLIQKLDDDRINQRPTFHYRLPNCNLEAADWYLHTPWNLWCVVEVLAGDDDLLERLTNHWLSHHDQLIQLQEPEWHSELEQIHKNLLSA